MDKQQLIAEVMRILDDSPRESLERMTVPQLRDYIECLYQTYPDERPKPKCPGCGRNVIHKMCPAWGTPKYMSGELFTEEDEATFAPEREAAMKASREAGNSGLD